MHATAIKDEIAASLRRIAFKLITAPNRRYRRPDLGLPEKKMRLTLHTDYALRVLIHVAVADGKLITIRDIAESFDISKLHLMKVVNDLSRKGYLDTVRGRGGGIRLRRLPRDINIGQVVRETEDKLDVIGCLGRGGGYCRIERVCVLRGVLRDAIQAFLAVLDGYTLAHLIKPHSALSSLLLLDRPAAHAP
jgi:Rrf2 family nitric oxide-sensitive transcriptional repressor